MTCLRPAGSNDNLMVKEVSQLARLPEGNWVREAEVLRGLLDQREVPDPRIGVSAADRGEINGGAARSSQPTLGAHAEPGLADPPRRQYIAELTAEEGRWQLRVCGARGVECPIGKHTAGLEASGHGFRHRSPKYSS